jgi:hypothetical protein
VALLIHHSCGGVGSTQPSRFASDEQGVPLRPFSRENCAPICGDSTIQEVKWKGAEDLSALAGKPVRFRFHLSRGRLCSCWVSPDASGASRGYVAAGGPGFTGTTDRAATAAYRAATKQP